MKGLIVLMCALVAVQARSNAVTQRNSTEAAKGENPWVVHLRVAVSTSGLLNTAAGSLIHQSWVLTAASSVFDTRFIWVRYGAVDVIRPDLVTENSLVSMHPLYDPLFSLQDNNIALISINRVVQSTDTISPVSLPTPGSGIPETATYCGFSEALSEVPGEILKCSVEELTVLLGVEREYIGIDSAASRFDIGAPLVSGSVQIGVQVDPEGTFLQTGDYLGWIELETGIDFTSRVPAVVGEDEGLKVNIVN